MSQFSEYLNELVKAREVTIKGLADVCDIDRTLLHKVLVGSRKPPNEQFVKKIADNLLLAKDEYEQLLEKYKIILMGEDTFNCRQKVAKIIRSISHRRIENSKSTTLKTKIDVTDIPDINTYYNQDNLVKNAQIIISYEIQQNSDISIVAQPSDILNTILKNCIDDSADTEIQHIFCLDNEPNKNAYCSYNLDVFSYISQLAIEYKNYKPFYYYDNQKSHINTTSLMPYVIITKNFVICSDSDFSSGLICKFDGYVDFYNNQFKNLKSKCKLLLSLLHDSESIESYYRKAKSWEICYNYQSCITLCCDRDIFYSCVKGSHEFKTKACELLESISKMQFTGKYINIFSETGIQDFMENGKLLDFPDNVYIPINKKDRKRIIKKMIYLTEKDLYHYRIVKDEHDMFFYHLCISADESNLCIQYGVDESTCYFTIAERSLVCAFRDYMYYLFESDKIYSKEETINILNGYMQN